MNVWFFSSSFPRPGKPSHCPYNVSLCRALAREHSVTALVPIPWTDRSWGSPVPRIEGAGEFAVRYSRFYYMPRLGRRLQARAMWRSARPQAIKAAKATGRPDWMLSYWTYPDAAAALRLAREFECPLVSMVGGSDVLLAREGTASWHRAADTLRAVDHVVTVSRDLADRINAMGVSPARITIMPRGVDTERFRPGDKRGARAALNLPLNLPVLLWVGRMVAVKNLDVLLRAAHLVRACGERFLLCLVGDGPLEGSVRDRIAELGLEPYVRLVGPAAHDQLPLWYQASDHFVLPSLSEGTPNVLLEAQACGKPFIASRVGGIPDLAVEGIDTLVAPSDAAALAAALVGAVAGPRDRRPPSFLDSWHGVASVIAQRAGEARAHA